MATLCPSVEAAGESASTLQFAKSCKAIEQAVKFNYFGDGDICTDTATLAQLNVQQQDELAAACSAAGLKMKAQYSAEEVELILNLQFKELKKEQAQKIESKTRQAEMAADVDLLAMRNQLDEQIKRN